MNSVRNFLAIIAVVLSGVCLDSEPQDVPTRQVPHFRLDVDLVEVDVVVNGEDGLPVDGLTVDDFELREDGVPQEISFLETVSARAAATAVRAEPGLLSDVYTNTLGRDGRLIVIVLDSDFPNTGRVRHFAREFRAKTGVTPAKAVERLRVEAARTALENGAGPVQKVAIEFVRALDFAPAGRAFDSAFDKDRE
mgnify:CR=1 FL=1